MLTEIKMHPHSFNKWTMICTWIDSAQHKREAKIVLKSIQTGCYRAHQIFANYTEWCVRCGLLCGAEYYVWIFEHSNMWKTNDAMDFCGSIYYYSTLLCMFLWEQKSDSSILHQQNKKIHMSEWDANKEFTIFFL